MFVDFKENLFALWNFNSIRGRCPNEMSALNQLVCLLQVVFVASKRPNFAVIKRRPGLGIAAIEKVGPGLGRNINQLGPGHIGCQGSGLNGQVAIQEVAAKDETHGFGHNREEGADVALDRDECTAHRVGKDPDTDTSEIVGDKNASKDGDRDEDRTEDGILEEACDRTAHTNELHYAFEIFEVFHGFLVKSCAGGVTHILRVFGILSYTKLRRWGFGVKIFKLSFPAISVVKLGDMASRSHSLSRQCTLPFLLSFVQITPHEICHSVDQASRSVFFGCWVSVGLLGSLRVRWKRIRRFSPVNIVLLIVWDIRSVRRASFVRSIMDRFFALFRSEN
ncbi:hypothetical protein HG531_011318 [Fusarium graminearum]|nr:hypothetical protein HG531_011318 [Fusarium graminearum]